MMPFDAYRTYLSLKNHFTKDSYDYHKYCGKSRVTVQSFYKRKDRFWFEKVTRQKSDSEVVEFFVANFVSCSDPERLWIGEIIKEGETNYTQWKKKIQSLAYTFKSEMENVFSTKKFDDMFYITNSKHPLLFKEHLQGNLSIESMIILDKILGYKNQFDKKMNDPVWNLTSMKIKKYSSFLNIDVFRYKRILKEVVLGEK